MSKSWLTYAQVATKIGGTPPSDRLNTWVTKSGLITYFPNMIDDSKLTGYGDDEWVVDDDITKKSFGIVFELGDSFKDIIGNYDTVSNHVTNSGGLYTFSSISSYLRINAKNTVSASTTKAGFNLSFRFNSTSTSIPASIFCFKIYNGPIVYYILQQGSVRIHMGGFVGSHININEDDIFTINVMLTNNTLVCQLNGATLYSTACNEIDNRYFSVGADSYGDFTSPLITLIEFTYNSII